MNLGEYLREKRAGRDWTQPEAAAHCGIEQSYLSKLENGKAFPSEEVFDKLAGVYELDIEALCDDLDEPELRKLKDLAAIRDVLAVRARKGVRVFRRSLIIGTALVVLGSGLLALWFWLDRAHPPSEYVYESKGVVLEGESPYLFKVMPWQGELAVMSGRAYDELFRAHPNAGEAEKELVAQRTHLVGRLDYHRIVSTADRGEMFIEAVDGGSRTYAKRGRQSRDRQVDSVYPFVLGVMSVVSGLLLFFIGRRWR